MSLPFVSVIIPTRNRIEQLTRCLSSLATQSYPSERTEIIVVNDGGAAVPDSLRGGVDPRTVLDVIDAAHAGPAAARNAGVARARGDILAFIDDDCTADPRWLAALVARLESDREAAIGGRVINALADNRYARASHLLVSHLYRYYHEQRRGQLPFFTTNNLGMRTETMTRVGPFDAGYRFAAEDRDWSDRCLLAGRPLVYEPEAVVHHAHDLTLASFFQQHFRYGQGAPRFHRIRSGRRGTGTQLEAAGFYGDMMRAPFVDGDPEPLRLVLLIAASQVAYATGWATSATRG